MVLRFMAGMLAAWLAASAAWAAAPPVRWTAEQRKKLAERDRLEESIPRLARLGKYDEMIEAAERVAALHREVLGETASETIGALQRLARLHEALGQFDRAVKAWREMLRLVEKRLGKGHWRTMDARIALEDARRLAAMKEDARRPAAIAREDAHRLAAISLRLYGQGKEKEAIPLAIKACDAYKEILGERHTDYAGALINLAAMYQRLGEHAKALPLLEKALDIRKQALGEKHPNYANVLNSLGCLHEDLNDYAKALPLLEAACDIYAETLGDRHPSYANCLNNLVLLHRKLGKPAQALPRLKRASELRKEAVGEKHPLYADSLDALATLYRDLGEPKKALALYTKATDIRKEALGERHPDYAISLNNVAALFREQGVSDVALLLMERAYEIRKEAGKLDASNLNNLATLYMDTGAYAKALPLMEKARDLTAQTRGERHPDYATVLSSLAGLYRAMGEHDKALPLYEKARDLRKQTLGRRHPAYANGLNGLAMTCRQMGRPKEAARHAEEAVRALEGYLDDCFDSLSEPQRHQILQHVLHQFGALASFQEDAGLPAAERYAPVLAWKGRIATYGVRDRFALDEPRLKEEAARLKAVRRRLASLTLRTPEPAQAAWLEQVQKLTEEKEALEAELARGSLAFRKQRERLTLTPEQLAKLLPDGVALVDLIEYDHYSPPKGGKGEPQREQRLLAFVSRPSKNVVVVPLGASKPVADAVARWRAEVQKDPTKADRKAIAASAAVIREKVWDRLAKHLGDAKTVIVSPDGALCQFPLAALPGSKASTYLIEEVAIAQVASAAQLSELLEPVGKDAKQGKGLLAVGGIDYGKGDAYDPLPGTGPEATRCRDLFRKSSDDPATLLSDKDATPAALRKKLAGRPRYLHLATHGYFEPADKVERLLKGLRSDKEGLILRWQQEATLSNLPSLRCGLALSGANQAPPDDDPDALPNVLTGQDLEGMDLRGCDVAVLSACQTALGDVKRSQGVLGLQRALHAAGVRTTVTSLWSVQDAATAELMEEFYKNLWGKKLSRLEALRQAQLAILRDPERVRKRSAAMLREAEKRGYPDDLLRGPKGRFATDLPSSWWLPAFVVIDEAKKPKTSPEAWWAAFVLCGDWR